MSALLRGPHVRRPGDPAAGAPPLLLLHGMGGDERTLLPLARRLSPASAVLSLRGHVLEDGQARFYRRDGDHVIDQEDLAARTDALAEGLAASSADLGVAAGSWVAVGFSNGAIFATSVLLRRPEVLAGAVLLATRTPFERPEHVPPPVPGARRRWAVVSNGDADPIATPEHTTALVAQLRAHEVAVEVVGHPRGHNVDPRVVGRMSAVLARGGPEGWEPPRSG